MAISELLVGVDEFTLVLVPPERIDAAGWDNDADYYIKCFLEKSRLEEMFGPLEKVRDGLQAGYTDGLTYVDRPWRLMICWHDYMPMMGVCVRVSAYAWAAYQQRYEELYGTRMNVWIFLDMVQAFSTISNGTVVPIYRTRLSRIDLVADYKDYPGLRASDSFLSPDALYTSILQGSIAVKDYRERRVIRSMSAFDKDGQYETFYLGGKRNKSNCFLRCYDKRKEQIETGGYRYNEAISCESWVRFEAVFRHDYAHQITDMLLEQQMTPQELQRMIAKMISDKFRFYDTALDDVITITNDLLDVATGAKAATLHGASTADMTLKQAVRHLEKGSGLYSTLYKFFLVWGNDGEEILLRHLYRKYRAEFKPQAQTRKELNAWNVRHFEELKGTDIYSSL